MPRRRLVNYRPPRRQERLHAAIADLRRRYGPHIIRLGADLAAPRGLAGPARLSTGSLGLDLMVGGLPRGAVTEYAGVEGAGSETLALAAVAACQRDGGLVLLVDAEGAADGEALAQAGINLAALVLVCPATALEAWDVMVALCRCGALDLLVAALPSLLALPGAGWGPLRLDRLLDRVSAALRGRGGALLLTNRPVPLPGQTAPLGWATVGGQAMARMAALRIGLRPTGVRISPYGDVAALRARATAVKYRGLCRSDEVYLELTARGPQRSAELVALGRATGCLEETALGLSLAGCVLGRTAVRAADALDADTALAAELERRIRAAWGAPAAGRGRAGAAP